MEKYIKIPTPDGFEIKGVLNSKANSDKLIIFVHGFTGSMNEAHYYCAKEYFTQRGYDVFRFNLYTDGEKTRKLHTCSIQNHAEDIEAVIQYFQGEYKELCMVGHSLAGPSIVRVKHFSENTKRIIFWDPAFNSEVSIGKISIENNKIFRAGSGKIVEISSEMHQELLDNKHIDFLKDNNFSYRNMYCIYAENDKHKINKSVTDELGIEGITIKDTTHCFREEGKFEELFAKTLEFIEK